jgi:hypothetical protein
MKKWMPILLLSASLAIAEEPAQLPPAPPSEHEVIEFEAVKALLADPAPEAPNATPSAAAPGTIPATAPVKIGTTLPTTKAVATEIPTTAPAATQLATTGPATVPTSAPTTLAATGPTTGPTAGFARPRFDPRDSRFSRPAPPAPLARVVPIPKPLPVDYAVLSSRSFFVHGRMLEERGPRDNGPGDQGPDGSPRFPTPSRPEKNLLFNGSTRADGDWVALIEDTAAAKIIKVNVGDNLAQGKVSAITLTTLDYDAAGKTVRISLGQNLDGEAIAGSTTRPSDAGATSGPAPAGSGGPPLDILERMRQKRAAELGGK